MKRLSVSATKSNFLRLRDSLAFAREGKELLTQKREVLVMEMLRLQDDAKKVREELESLLARGYRTYARAAMLEGVSELKRLSLAIAPAAAPEIEERSLMGVMLPIVKCRMQPTRIAYRLGRGSYATDQTVHLFEEVARKLCEVAEIETAIYRLAMETRKTIRRERALENLFIPQYEATIKFIEESLEEKERETFYQMSLIKGRKQE